MQLLCSPSSPYVRKARITLREKGLAGRIEEVMIVSIESPARLLAANPLSKIPVLERPDGPPLMDSPVIVEYLDSLPSTAPDLLPKNGEARWQALRLQALADGAIDACFNLVMENRRDEAMRSPFWQDRWMNAVLRTLDQLELEAVHWPEQLDVGQIATGALLGYLDLRMGDLGWRKPRAQLAKRFDGWMERPSFIETIPKDPA